jgi:hypothetical protein
MQRGAESSKAKGRSKKRECESITAARGENPFSRKTLPLVPISPGAHQSDPASDTGARGHKSYSWCAVLRVLRRRTATREANYRPRQYCGSSGPPQKTEKVIFQTDAAVSRRLAHGPARPSCVGAAGQSVAGTDVAVGVSEGGLTVITSANPRKQRANCQSSFGPTCRLVYSPEAGPGATISTLEQGYPLLQYEGTESTRLSLVAWQTTTDPTTRAAPGPPRGQRRRYPPRYRRWVRTPMGSVGTLYTRTGPPGKVQDPHGHEPDPWYGSRTPLCGVWATHGRVPGFWDKEYPDLNQDQAGVRS